MTVHEHHHDYGNVNVNANEKWDTESKSKTCSARVIVTLRHSNYNWQYTLTNRLYWIIIWFDTMLSEHSIVRDTRTYIGGNTNYTCTTNLSLNRSNELMLIKWLCKFKMEKWFLTPRGLIFLLLAGVWWQKVIIP